MTSPAECRERFPDELAIRDEVRLLRRIPPWHFVHDENEGRYRPSSAAFNDGRDGDPMSVYRADVIQAESDRPERVMVGHGGFGLVSILAGAVRRRNQTVHPDPLPDESAHANVCGPKTRATRGHFVRCSEWIVEPPP